MDDFRICENFRSIGSRLNGEPSKKYIYVPNSEPVNVILFGKRGFADIIKLRILR